MVDEFIKGAPNDLTEIAEMVLLGPVLDKETYRRLSQHFIISFEQFLLLNINLLEGHIQLVQSGSRES
jgi:hypothetical protein